MDGGSPDKLQFGKRAAAALHDGDLAEQVGFEYQRVLQPLDACEQVVRREFLEREVLTFRIWPRWPEG